MRLKVLKDDGSYHLHPIHRDQFYDQALKERVGYIGTASKESNALNIFRAYFSNAKAILLDESNQGIVKQLKELSIEKFEKEQQNPTIFDEHPFSLLYYTSGSTGSPVAALKSKKHITAEIQALSQLLQPYQIKKVIVTVPFVHLYGTLLGLFYPLLNNIDILLKEHFLPHDLLELIDPNTMIVTTPLYIKALNQLAETKDLSQSLFISSTAALDSQSAKYFKAKFKADIIQIFGSTETGGIAYKRNDASIWKPFEGVEISTNKEGELHVQSPFVSELLYENGFKQINGAIQTFDYIEKEKEGFRLVGRSSKIFKVAGKRYSTVQIEDILEGVAGIEKALVFVELSTGELRGEYLDITIESQLAFSSKEIKNILRKALSNLKFSMKLKIVEKIPTNLVGKKLKIQ